MDQLLQEAVTIGEAAEARWARLDAAVRRVCERIAETARSCHVKAEELIGHDLDHPRLQERKPSPYYLIVSSSGEIGIWWRQELKTSTDSLREAWRIGRPGDQTAKRLPRHILEACVPALRKLSAQILDSVRTTAHRTEHATREAETLADELEA
jgi:plasmid stabilization system protein ParE